MKLNAVCSKCACDLPAVQSASGAWELPAGWTSLQVGGVDYQLCAADATLWAANLSATFAGFLANAVAVTSTPVAAPALTPPV